MTKIESFRGDYAFLSNFHPAVVTLDGMDYPSVEHAFQAAKTHNLNDRCRIQSAPNPPAAKAIGRGVILRQDWDDVRYSIMEALVRQKFTNHPELRELLLATGDAEIIEGNDWNDRTWGMTRSKNGEWIGKNWLGKILMTVRNELRETG